jgi:hypothetical protein
MAAFINVSLDTVRSKMITSIHGKRLGLDPNDVLLGPVEFMRPIVACTSDTTGTIMFGAGVYSVDTTTDDGWRLGQPIPGATVEIFTATTSTGTRTITMGTATTTGTWAMMSSAAITYATIVIKGGGQYLKLIGLTTDLYGIVTRGTGGIASSAVSTEMVIS